MDEGYPRTHRVRTRPAFDCIALLLQGGGALGAYQGGVYQALAEADLHPDWAAGISIGAINAAIIAGNPPAARVDKLRQFWEERTRNPGWSLWAELVSPFVRGDRARSYLNQAKALNAILFGVPGLFRPRPISPWLNPDGAPEALSYFESAPLKATLERIVDFDRINAGAMRLSVGAVNIRSGNFVYFDTTTHAIRPEHVLASGALPPGFPPVAIEGEHYWDGGLVSNTPLQWVLQYGPRRDTLAFQVDLWSTRGDCPRNLAEVATRQKEILYSSRTRDHTDRFKHAQRVRHAVADLLEKLPAELKDGPELELLKRFGDHKVYNIVHLIYRAKTYEGDSKDYEFSRRSMEEHWQAGYDDTVRSLRHPEVLERPRDHDGVMIFDFTE